MKTIKLLTIVVIMLTVTSCFNKNQDSIDNKLAKQIPIEDFFKKPQQSGYQLSSDGKSYIYRAPVNGISNIFIQEIGKPEPRQLTNSTDRDINNFYWGTNNYVLYKQDNEGDENYKLYRLDIQTKEITCLTDFENSNTTIIDFYSKNPNEIIIGLNKRDPECSDVYQLNILSGELRMVEQNPGDVRDWMVDNNGVVRIAYAVDILYRKDEKSEFKKLIDNEGEDDTFTIHYFTPDNKNVYAYSSIGRDKIAIVEYDLDANKEVNVLFEDSVYDAFGDDERDYFEYSKSKQKLIYAVYTAKKRTLYFFDAEMKNIYNKLKEKVGNYEINFKSISDDFKTFIFYTSSDKLEGTTYFYDYANDNLKLLSKATPWLDENEMAEMKPIQYKSKDGLTIHGYLTIPKGMEAKDLPVIVNPHPGPQWRNSWGFNEFVQFYANRGYAVLNVNFRGSEGYGKNFLRAGFKQWGLKMQDDITDGVNWLIEQGIADKDRIAIYGLSFGGSAALAGITFTPDLYACGIDFWGTSNYFTWYNGFPPRWKPYMSEIHRRWMDPSVDSLQMYQTSPVFHVKNIKAPVFIAQSANDSRVRLEQSEEMVEELKINNKKYEYFLIEGEGHALTNEKKLIELMEKVESFLAKNMQNPSAKILKEN
ncbi:MAG: S9 family peptidase [Salinivirgaceae bacterium]|nr:S9 family peptidase [Salinivirgaceae bacterium]